MVVMLKRAAALATLSLVLAALLLPSLRAHKRAHWTRLALLDLQRGLQSHLVAKEHYPMLDQAPATDLAEFLNLTGHLPRPPDARWMTNMVYRSGGEFKTFALTVTRPGSTNVWFSLDESSSL